VVQEALEAAQQANMIETLGYQPDAWSKMVDWHKQAKVAQQIGSDPEAYAQKVEARDPRENRGRDGGETGPSGGR
jgi:hypothetical protein